MSDDEESGIGVSMHVLRRTGAVLGLVGAKRVGKDATADILVAEHGFTRLAFADKLKDLAYAVDPYVLTDLRHGVLPLSDLVGQVGWEGAKTYPGVRQLLQRLGDAARTVLDPSVWVRPVIARAAELADIGQHVVVTDVRYPNEVAAVRSIGGGIVHVSRPGVVDDDPHPSEALAWSSELRPDWVIRNTGTLDDLAEYVGTLARAVVL